MGRTTNGKQALESMRLAYRSAKDCGDKEEEAKWANQIGHAYKDAGEYVVALKWFRIDYEISTQRSCVLEPVKLMPTCQSMGEVYLRLHNYDEALVYQSKHFHLAEQAGDLVEQQRASTQLGRTYLELYEIADRHSALKDAKLYFQTALDLAHKLKSNPPAGEKSSSAFVVELVDAHNNVGLARALSEDYEGAFRFYSDGLKLCDEEEVDAYDAARTRIHHNLGRLYVELRDWDKAKQHIDMDILICQSIPHAQGESKGLMNKGELFFKKQDYEQATRCFRRALQIAQTLEDEDKLCLSIKDNIEVVEQAKIKAKEMEADMQRLSRLKRDVAASKGTACERKLLKQESKLLQELIQRAEELHGWGVHLGLAKSLKRLSKELGDNELLGDALEIVASSYYNIRDFDKAIKWHWKSFQQCKRIGHLEGQTVAKINYGNALDAAGRWEEALKAYKEAYQIAKKLHNPKKIDQQMSALDNVHYLYLVRLENVEKARKVEVQRKRLQNSKDTPSVLNDDREERCSETGSEGSIEDQGMADVSTIPFHESDDIDIRASNFASERLKVVVSDSDQESDDNIPSPSACYTMDSRRPRRESSSRLLPEQPNSRSSKLSLEDHLNAPIQSGGRRNLTSGRQKRKLLRAHRKLVISDEEMDELSEAELGRQNKIGREPCTVEDSESDHPIIDSGETRKIRRIVPSSKRSAVERFNLSSDEDTSTPSGKKLMPCRTSMPSSPSPSPDLLSSPGHHDYDIPRDNDLISMPPNTHLPVKTSNIPNLRSPCGAKVRVFSSSQRKFFEACPGSPILVATDSALPVISPHTGPASLVSSERKHLPEKSAPRFAVPDKVSGNLHARSVMSDLDAVGCVRSPLVERYLTHCMAVEITPNSIIKHKLESQKVSEEVVVTGCNMEDTDALPLFVALKESDAFSLLDMSHNSLGNATVHAIQDLIKSTNQTDLGLTLDLHCNKLGAGALMQLCHCPVSLSRLEVLNLSGNRLTDAAARNLCKIMKESQALAALNLEACGLTSRSITQLTSSIPLDSSLTKLWIGKNHPVAGLAVQELLNKLSFLTSFSELDLKGLELDDAAVAGVCTLVLRSKSISVLNLKGTDIANEEALTISDALDLNSPRLSKLDLSFNVFDRASAATLCSRLISIHSLSTLNISGNNLDQKAVEVISQGLARISCRLKVLDLSNCRLGQSSVVLIMQSLQDHPTLIDLNLSGNVSTSSLKLSHSTLEVSEGKAESSSKKRVRANLTVDELRTGDFHSTGLQDCSATSRQEGAAVPGYRGEARASCVTGGLGEEAEQKAVVHGDIHTGSTNLRDGISESVAEGDATGHNDRQPSNIDSIAVPMCGSASDADGADELRVQEENCEGRLGSSVRNDSRMQGEEPVQTGDAPEGIHLVSRAAEDGCQPDNTDATPFKVEEPAAEPSCATGANDGFCEQLAAAIRMAKGLRLLDLTDNELSEEDVKQLYLSWSSCPRGTSMHQQHVDGLTTVHFFVETRPCPCSNPPCCTAHSFTTC